jgi:hypothetical protein
MVSLRYLNIGFDELQDWPDLCQLRKLETLSIAGWQAEGFSSIGDFVLLKTLYVHKYKGMRSLPDLQKLKRLQKLEFCSCEFEDMSGLSNLTSLQDLEI